jgi:ankyrin repeat protein
MPLHIPQNLGVSIDHAEPELGITGLMAAARCGDLALTRHFLGRGASVHCEDLAGQTALIWATVYGHGQVVGTLLQAGAMFPEHVDEEAKKLWTAEISAIHGVALKVPRNHNNRKPS